MADARQADPSLTVVRDGEALVLTGALVRASIAQAWTRALPMIAGVRRIDLAGVSSVDSAGMAFLAEIASRAGNPVRIDGTPPGLTELRTAYRLDDGLGFAAA
jgi:phospholipid transport system transporter-binding protein